MWSECSCVIRIAESDCGSSPSDFIRLNVSRQEMPASTRILVFALDTIAQFPRLPEASIDTLTPMLRSIRVNPVDSGVTFWLSPKGGPQTSDLRPPTAALTGHL